jgi:hypothetical protein
MGIFIEWPWLALLPAVLFLALHHISQRKLAAVAGLAWLGYALYEYSMQRRWLCSGECNIRVDLLLLYPVLALISLAAGIVAERAIASRRRAAP